MSVSNSPRPPSPSSCTRLPPKAPEHWVLNHSPHLATAKKHTPLDTKDGSSMVTPEGPSQSRKVACLCESKVAVAKQEPKLQKVLGLLTPRSGWVVGLCPEKHSPLPRRLYLCPGGQTQRRRTLPGRNVEIPPAAC